MRVKNIGIEKAIQKIKHYCSFQERSHKQVRDKLYTFGLYKNEVETLLTMLIEENYLDEQRFAIAFAGGKFRMRQWGKIKIQYELRQRGVSAYSLKKALSSIDEDDYASTLQKLYEQKMNALRDEKYSLTKQGKIQSYLMQKGYEHQLVNDVLKNNKHNHG